MNTLRYQQTVAATVRVSGFGYWSGEDVQVEFRPAPPNTGLVFVRQDLAPPRRVEVEVRHRVEVPRRTNLVQDGVSVEMVEHVLAALAGLRIDNCEIWVDRPEMPGCDGSSWQFVEALQKAGALVQPELRRPFIVRQFTRVGDDDCWVEAHPVPHDGLEIAYELCYPGTPIGQQRISLEVTPASFCRELAAARTFLLKQEADWLRQQGLGNRVGWEDLLVFDDQGPIGNRVRFEDECVRHKALDLVGDLALLGRGIVGRIVARKTGHRLNAELVRQLLNQQSQAGPAETSPREPFRQRWTA